MKTMKQIWITKAGGPDVLVIKDVPIPKPKGSQVRIVVEAAGVNFGDIVRRGGNLRYDGQVSRYLI